MNEYEVRLSYIGTGNMKVQNCSICYFNNIADCTQQMDIDIKYTSRNDEVNFRI